MDVVALGPRFAAELRGVTLADVAHDDAAYQAVRAAFEAHSVLVFRDQDVTDGSQIAFSRRFGPLEITPAATQGAGTHLVILSTIGPDGKVVPADSRVALRNKANQLWHADSTFKSVPALASVLSARIIPSHGGETEYVSTGSPSTASTTECRSASQACSPGTTIRIPAARSRPTSSLQKSARRCRRNAGAWRGPIRRTAGARFILLRTLMPSKAWKRARRKS
jgi:alpha-ketoglutarate-dependent taurine dioxygenase